MSLLSYTLCPVCGQHKFSNTEGYVDICKHCGWQHDLVSESEPDKVIGPNSLSLNDYRIRYHYYEKNIPDYHWLKDEFPDIPQVQKMECPVCGKFKFMPLTWDEIAAGDSPSDSYCMRCGWHYDEVQLSNHDELGSVNWFSLNDYREWYANKIKENPEYDYFEEMTNNYIPSPHDCPVCGKYKFEDGCCHDICPYCGWEDDGNESSDNIGANGISFAEYKKKYSELIANNPKYKWSKEEKNQ